MEPTEPDILELPFTDAARGLRYRLSTSGDQASMRTIDSSFVTDRVFQLESRIPNLGFGDIGFGLDIKAAQLDSPLHKSFPDDEDLDGDDESPDCFTVVVENTNALSAKDAPTTNPNTPKHNNNIVAFVSAKVSSWNSRLIITDIEISPLYRRQGIGRNLIRFAERLGVARWPVRHVWLEVSNVNYPAIQSYLRMGFKIAGLDVSLYVGTPAEGELAIFMWKEASGTAEEAS
ncbi:acyl-CoA N-acyltransferase [Aspergillus minisclerotigenes]|uniref:Acyl-CoA N-acyltransferase n=1 Tax=Aspergillus minisclerotigenes TaxID=656917 RepID=A0A5N6JGS3_9EURO|nr:acyl-CoA N-acyltransferase [Aspergillus minisclerotigenes]